MAAPRGLVLMPPAAAAPARSSATRRTGAGRARARAAAAPRATAPAAKEPRVHAYAREVVAGRIVAGRYVVAACRRHLADLARAGCDDHGRRLPAAPPPVPDGLVWLPEKAESALVFFEDVLHLRDGVPFRLDEFQAFIVGSLFGWHKRISDSPDPADDIRRRFRFFYGEIGKANGKTPLAAGIGLYGLVVDDEHAPEIYSAAAAKEQAMICFRDASQMVEASPELQGTIEVLTNSLAIPGRHAAFRPLSSEDRGQHGKRVHMAILDEIHAHNSAAITRAIVAGTKARRNALIVLITNSGSDRTGICWSYHETARRVLEGSIQKDDLFAYVCTLDPCPECEAAGKRQPDPKCRRCDKPTDRAVWAKANPRIADPEVRRYVAERVELMRTMPSETNDVLQLNFCLWTQSDAGWLSMYAWHNRCHRAGLRLEDFRGRTGSVAMDAANKIDLTSMAVVFEREAGAGRLDVEQLDAAARAALAAAVGAQGSEAQAELVERTRELSAAGYAIFWRHFLPEDTVENADGPNHELYREWRRSGHLIVTPGARTSFARIGEELRAWRELFRISRFGFDPREMSYFVEWLQGQDWCDFPLVEVVQSPSMISQPMKELEGLVNAGLFHHDGDPVAAWAMGNVVQKTAHTGGQAKAYFPARPAEHAKIDPAAAAIMALDGALRAPETAGEVGVF